MWNTIRSISSLLLSYGLLLLANGLVGTLLGLRSRLEGFSTEITGFIMAGFFVGMLMGGIYAMRVVAAVGHIRAFAAFASIMSVAVLAHDAGQGGLSLDDWNERGREAGIGKKRRADLTDARMALKGKKLVYESDGKWLVQ